MHNNRKMCDSTMISAKICMNLSYPQIEGARKKMIQRDDLDFFSESFTSRRIFYNNILPPLQPSSLSTI